MSGYAGCEVFISVITFSRVNFSFKKKDKGLDSEIKETEDLKNTYRRDFYTLIKALANLN